MFSRHDTPYILSSVMFDVDIAAVVEPFPRENTSVSAIKAVHAITILYVIALILCYTETMMKGGHHDYIFVRFQRKGQYRR